MSNVENTGRPAEPFSSTADQRVSNNPPQQPRAPGDPMRLQYRPLSDAEKQLEDSCMRAVRHITG